MGKLITSGTGVLAALVLFIGLNVISARTLRAARVDLTENDLYTLSEGTKNILANLEEPITLRFYFSRGLAGDLPQFETYGRRIEDLLLEYERRSNGNLRVEFLDPEPFSEIEERAIGFGLSGIPVGKAGELLYFGLVGTNTLDDEEIIPFFEHAKEEVLEYDLTKRVYALSDPQRPVVGVLSTLPMEGTFDPATRQAPQPWILMDQLKEQFDVETVDPEATDIPENIDVLMIVHPKGLADATLYAIDQFVLGGGNAMVFVDPHCEADIPPSDPQNPMAQFTAERGSDLNRLTRQWGLELMEGVFAADKVNAIEVPFTSPQTRRTERVPYLAYLRLTEASYTDGEVITNQMGPIHMGTAGVLKAVDGATTEITPLVETSTESMRVDVSRVKFQPDPFGLLEDFFPTDSKLMLAARINGVVETAFPGGRPVDPMAEDTADATAEPEPEHRTSSDGPVNVIVVADADMLEDRWWVRAQDMLGMRLLSPTADNLTLVSNSLDNLTGSNDLISLRGRAGFERPFERVEELERNANDKFRERALQLEAELRETEERINSLQQDKQGASAFILSPEQEAELDSFRQKQIDTKRELRDLRFALRKDIDSLGSWLKFVNVWLVPLLLLVGAGAVWFTKGRK